MNLNVIDYFKIFIQYQGLEKKYIVSEFIDFVFFVIYNKSLYYYFLDVWMLKNYIKFFIFVFFDNDKKKFFDFKFLYWYLYVVE